MTINDILDMPVAQRLVAMLGAGYIVRPNEYNDWARDLYQPDGIVYVGTVTVTEIELARDVLRLRAAISHAHSAAMASYTPADATELHEAILPTLRAALSGGDAQS